MKASPVLISWHNENSPVYSTHFDPHGKGRFATSGGDNNVRLWRIVNEGDERSVEYLSTLIKHTQAVNVVRFAPKGELLATAGDDGNTLLWVPSEVPQKAMGDEPTKDKESWRVKHMCRSFGSEIYDLAWSPDAVFFLTGSMDNVARIYNAHNGQMVRQIAEHNHYVQGVAWDPLNEFVATQSSDRSVHIYNLKNKDGEFTLNKHNSVSRMDLPGRRISASSPAPNDGTVRPPHHPEPAPPAPASPAPSASIPGTPTSLAPPMNPPVISHSRRSSFGSSPSMRRSASPAPSMPLPAVRPMEHSPVPHMYKNTSIYANETCTSFFRRLTFAPDGSLLFTPAGQYKVPHPTGPEGMRQPDEIANTVYVYTRAGLNKPPVTHLPGHKKPSIAVKCSPVFYALRQGPRKTVHITLDTSSADGAIADLPDPVVPTSTPSSSMDPPKSADRLSFPNPTMPSPKETGKPSPSPETPVNPGPFALPYRMIYAVATHDAVLVYDTQHTQPLCIISNLHFATFTDLAWSTDGLTLVMSSSDGFCSYLAFQPGELGPAHAGPHPTFTHPHPHAHVHGHPTPTPISTATSVQASPVPTPTAVSTPTLARLPGPPPAATAASSSFAASAFPPLPAGPAPPAMAAPSPTKSRSNSASSVATQASHATAAARGGLVGNSPTPTLGAVPGVTAAASGPTPPMTPMPAGAGSGPATTNGAAAVLGKREGEAEAEPPASKKRRIAPTPINPPGPPGPAAA